MLRSKLKGAAADASCCDGDSSPGTGPYPGGMKCSGSSSLSAGVGVGRSRLKTAPGKFAGNGGGARAAPQSSSSPRNGAAGPPSSQSIGGMWNAGGRGAAGLGAAAGAA